MLLFRRKPRIAQPRIAMTLLVRDEADVIDLFVRYHVRLGLDALVVTDHGSKDGTRDILETHRRSGAITELIDETSPVFEQARFVDRMIRLARDRHAADYCINSDADEFWCPASGSFRHELGRSRADVIVCTSFHMLPVSAEKLFWEATDRVVKRAKAEKLGPRKHYNLFDNPARKSIHRTQGYHMVSAGNHDVAMDNAEPVIEASKDIFIYHYGLRNLAQFRKKILQNGAALEANPNAPESEGSHWRYMYRGHQAGTLDLEAEFDTVIAKAERTRFRQAGVVVTDFRMRDALAKLTP